jgi:8-amino-7-oxononanoate synthase
MPDPSDPIDKLLIPLLATRGEQHLLRQLRTLRPIDAVHVVDEIDGTRYVNFSSNNYLGLSHHLRVIEAVERATREFGAGAVASPLITGHTVVHASAEAAIARWKGTEASLLLPSGYQANHAVVQTIVAVAEAAGRRVRFLLDKLLHASLIDAVRGSGLPLRAFAHNDLGKLERLVATPTGDDEMQVVLTESIFSMDGDAAPLREIAALKRKHAFTLVVDEAHGSGVYGPGGAGYAAEVGATRDVDAFVVTLSKALGLSGGAICGSKRFCDAVVNFGRAYIYSTATPPMLAAGCEAAIEAMRDEPDRQRRVRALASRVRSDLKLPAGDSPIIPIVLGDERAALDAAEGFKRDGMLLLAVRPPTVPRGTSRLRVTLSCEHSDADVDRLVGSLSELRK